MCKGLHRGRLVRLPMLTSVHHSKAPTMGMWASEPEHRAVEEGGLVYESWFNLNHVDSMGVCVAYLEMKWHKNALYEEDKSVERVGKP